MTKVIMNAPHAGEVRYVRDFQAAGLVASGQASIPVVVPPAITKYPVPSVEHTPVDTSAAAAVMAADSTRAHAPAVVAHPEIATDTVNPKKV